MNEPTNEVIIDARYNVTATVVLYTNFIVYMMFVLYAYTYVCMYVCMYIATYDNVNCVTVQLYAVQQCNHAYTNVSVTT